MKTKSFFAILTVIAITAQLSAQNNPDKTKTEKPGNLNLSYSVGFTGNIKTNGYNDNARSGFNYILDASYTPEGLIGFFVIYSSTNLTGTLRDFNQNVNSYFADIKFNYTQLSFGPRFYTGNKDLFADVGMGYHNIDNRKSIGFTAGIGSKIKLSDSYGVVLSGRIYNAFAGNLSRNTHYNNNAPFIYYGLYAGFEINDKNQTEVKNGRRRSKISMAALAGKNSYDGNGDGTYAFGVEMTYDIEKNISIVSNVFFSKNESYNYDFYKSSNFQNDISGGARVYFGESNLKLFLESLAGLYVINTDIPMPGRYFDSENNASVLNVGLNFGAGAEFNIISPVSGLFKLNVQNYFRGGTYTGIFGGLKYRF